MAKKTKDESAEESAPQVAGFDEAAIAEKVAAGLTRAQAIEVLANQAAHDSTLKD